MFDGKSLPDGEEWICCLVKDSLYKAFFIRIIDPKVHYPHVLHLSSITPTFANSCFDLYIMETGERAGRREEDNQAIWIWLPGWSDTDILVWGIQWFICHKYIKDIYSLRWWGSKFLCVELEVATISQYETTPFWERWCIVVSSDVWLFGLVCWPCPVL